MKNKKTKIFLIFFFLISSVLVYLKFFKNKNHVQIDEKNIEEPLYKSNIIKDVKYVSKDLNGNEYIIDALQGEIDFNNSNVIYLTTVKALIKLNNSNDIVITSDYGKYNLDNFDTIFSKNVIMNYMNNKITGEYLDSSIARNLMIISRNVIYTNEKNILEADLIEINIKTKDTKISMYEKDKKVNIRSKK
ncbi:LPS export ABC transporter periplasmic protein LptC [Candidatus Pelagibacter sp.]|nr:LPS export ABC transporter periplasmic protein LptC [Candidatus Pelagibacter sp.]MDC0642297.1 LPS export ABC transporter periplasmic protein LptC [Candidatus Pelagibacter sp.]